MTDSHGFTVSSQVKSTTDGNANNVVMTDNVWLTYANVAYVTGTSGSNVINISSLTGSYNIINDGNYSNTAAPLLDIVNPGDYILVANNTEKVVVGVTANTITLGSSLTNNVTGLMSARRNMVATYGDNVLISGFIGVVYTPDITDELGNILTTENGSTILLG